MNKNLLKLFLLILAVIAIFAIQDKVFAQFPSFELYCDTATQDCSGKNSTEYPLVENVTAVLTNSAVVVTATIIDESGVSIATASIDGIDGSSITMNDEGNNVYKALLPLSGLSASGDYYVNIKATDWLLHNSGDVYNKIASFSIRTTSCQPSGGAELCIYNLAYTNPTVSSLVTDSVLSSVSAGSIVGLTATMSSNILGLSIVFTDTTAGTTIGTATTDQNGVATINYNIPIDTATLPHTLKATYTGNGSGATTKLNIAGSGWGFRKAIVIDSYENSDFTLSSSLTNFPLYVKITDPDIIANAASNGYDIRFTDSNGTPLNYERESWSSSTGGSFWVNVPTISSTADTIIYIYYGKIGATDGQDATLVWDSDYKGVWHLNELSGNNADSTSNQRTAIASGSPTVVAGQIGNAKNYVGSGDVSAIEDILLDDLSYTATAWFYYPAPATSGGWWTLLRGADDDYGDHQIIIRNSDSHLGGYDDNEDVGFIDSGYSGFTTGWHYIGIIANPSPIPDDEYGYSYPGTANFYVDGVKVGSTIDWYSSSDISYFGNSQRGGENFGKVDELRISTTARSADWMKFEYFNMSSNELSFGDPQLLSYDASVSSVSATPNPVASGSTVDLQANLSVSVNGLVVTFYDTDTATDVTAMVGSVSSTNGVAQLSYAVAGGAFSSTHTITASFNGTYQTTPLDVTGQLISWKYKKAIIISHANVSADLANFPLYVNVTDADIKASAISTGYDIRFTDANGTVLNYERESWSSANGGSFWVKVPTISSIADTIIYAYYGKLGATDVSSPSLVWDSNYKGVWHLNGTETPTTWADSTLNANTGINNGATATTGRLGGAASFNGTSSYIQIANPTSSNPAKMSVSVWVKRPTSGNYRDLMRVDGGWTLEDGDCGTGESYFWVQTSSSGTNLSRCNINYLPSDNAWHYVVGTYNGSSTNLYVDNILKSSFAQTGTVSGSSSSSSRIGSGISYYYFDGSLDEVRVSTTARSEAWNKFEYYNMSSSTNELTFEE